MSLPVPSLESTDEWVHWMRLQTAWARHIGPSPVMGEGAASDAAPVAATPDCLAWFCVDRHRLDEALEPLGLLAWGAALRSFDRSVLQSQFPAMGMPHWRWALRCLQQMGFPAPAELPAVESAADRRVLLFTQVLRSVQSTQGRRLTERLLPWLLQEIDCDLPKPGELYGEPSPERVCLPAFVWDSLMTIEPAPALVD